MPPPARLPGLTGLYLSLSLAQVGRAFLFKQRNAKFTTELRAGLITFLMASDRAIQRQGRSLAQSGCCHWCR